MPQTPKEKAIHAQNQQKGKGLKLSDLWVDQSTPSDTKVLVSTNGVTATKAKLAKIPSSKADFADRLDVVLVDFTEKGAIEQGLSPNRQFMDTDQLIEDKGLSPNADAIQDFKEFRQKDFKKKFSGGSEQEFKKHKEFALKNKRHDMVVL